MNDLPQVGDKIRVINGEWSCFPRRNWGEEYWVYYVNNYKDIYHYYIKLTSDPNYEKAKPYYVGSIYPEIDQWEYVSRVGHPPTTEEFSMSEGHHPHPHATTAQTIDGTVGQIKLVDEIIWQSEPITAADLPRGDVPDEEKHLTEQARIERLAKQIAEDWIYDTVKGQYQAAGTKKAK